MRRGADMDREILAAARVALDNAGGDMVEASRLMLVAAHASPSLYHKLMDPLAQGECYAVIRTICREQGHSTQGRSRGAA